MIARLPVWLKLTAVNVVVMVSLIVALTSFAVVTMKASVSDRLQVNQVQNLRLAAMELAAAMDGVTIDINGGEVRRITVETWPDFATEAAADHEFIDRLGVITGETAIIFAYDPAQKDFVRRTTNIIKDNGERAVGTVLGAKSAAMAPIMEGKPFLGTAVILGKSYRTLYQPIFAADPSIPQTAGGVAGILYVGVRDAVLIAETNAFTGKLSLIAFGVAAAGIAISALFCFGQLRPLRRAADDMTALARGEHLEMTQTRKDELGAMQGALIELAEVSETATKRAQIIEQLDLPILTVEPDSAQTVTYANAAALTLFGQLAGSGGQVPANPVGRSARDVHAEARNAAQSRRNSKPVKIGEETVIFHAVPLKNAGGRDAGVCLSIDVVTQRERTATQFETDVADLMTKVSGAVTILKERTHALEDAAHSGTSDSGEAARVAVEAADAVRTVATAVEQLNSSFGEVAERIARNAQLASEASTTTQGASQSAEALEVAGKRIQEVVNLIAGIAEQTNLLALNATIEASRAGDAGKGFAVVATEVKSLAERAANATTEITSEIERFNAAGRTLLDAIQQVAESIKSVDEVSAAVAAAVNEQQVTTTDIARTVHEVASSAERVRSLSQNVSTVAGRTGEAAGEVSRVTLELDQTGQELTKRSANFLASIRTAA